jgi:dipeptidyl aminopeptidase/acylaminoacyl peptidase
MRARYGTRVRRAALALVLLLATAAAGHAQTAAQLVEIVDLSGVTASPDGSKVAFRSQAAALDGDTYRLKWHVVDLSSGAERQVGGGGDPVYTEPGAVRTEAAFWSPDGRFLFYRALVDGRIGLWRAAADGSSATLAFAGEANIEDVALSEDGRSLELRLGPTRDEIQRAEQSEYDSGILVDAHVDLGQSVFRGAFIDGRKATQRLTGYWFRRAGLLWDEPRRTLRFDLQSSRLLNGQTSVAAASLTVPNSEPDLSARSADGAVATAKRGDRDSTLSVRRAPFASPIVCEAPQCRTQRIVALDWRPRHEELLFTTQDERQDQRLYLWSIGAGSVRLLAGGHGLLSGGREARTPCAVTAESAICVAAAVLSPPRLERIDLDSGASRTLFAPNAGLAGSDRLVAEQLEWASTDGQTFTGVLIAPRERTGPLPLVINYYRCEGYVRGGLGDELPFAPLAASGIASLCINSGPGSPHAETNYRRAEAGVRAAIELLSRRGLVDRARVGMAGLSFGSEVAMWIAVHSDLLAAVSISSTQIEPGYYWMNAVRGRDQPAMIGSYWGLGAPDATPAAWRRISPGLNVATIKAPVLMQLPEQETRDVLELYARLTNSTAPAELYAFPDEAHVKILPRHKLAVYQRNLDWFRFWLQNYVDPDPARTAQFARWRALAARRGPSSQDRSHSSVAASSMTRK